MKFDDAIKKSIKAFLDGKLPEGLIEAQGKDIIYTPEYMDDLAEMPEEPEMEEDDG
jgi:hypothetical protein